MVRPGLQIVHDKSTIHMFTPGCLKDNPGFIFSNFKIMASSAGSRD